MRPPEFLDGKAVGVINPKLANLLVKQGFQETTNRGSIQDHWIGSARRCEGYLGAMTSEIEQLIQRFVSGEDTSIDTANEIEVPLDDSLPDDDYVQQTVEMLAMYRPEGGEFLFDTAAI